MGGKESRVIDTEFEQVSIPQELMYGTTEVGWFFLSHFISLLNDQDFCIGIYVVLCISEHRSCSTLLLLDLRDSQQRRMGDLTCLRVGKERLVLHFLFR